MLFILSACDEPPSLNISQNILGPRPSGRIALTCFICGITSDEIENLWWLVDETHVIMDSFPVSTLMKSLLVCCWNFCSIMMVKSNFRTHIIVMQTKWATHKYVYLPYFQSNSICQVKCMNGGKSCVVILHWHLQEETRVHKMNSGLGVNTTISFSNPISYRLWLNVSLKGANKYRCGVNTKDGKICSVVAEVQFEG